MVLDGSKALGLAMELPKHLLPSPPESHWHKAECLGQHLKAFQALQEDKIGSGEAMMLKL